MKRIAYFDNVKGILILFIIVAHVISLCATYYGYSNKILKINCLFMLQCFFFISGYFAGKSKSSKKNKIIKQIKTYIIWDTLITLYYYFSLHIISFDKSIILPRYTLWFLITLITYQLMEYVMDKVPGKVMIPLSVIVGVLSGFIPSLGLELSLARSCTFFPFYAIGYYSKDLDIIKLKSNKRWKYIMIISASVLLYFLLNNNSFFSLKLLKGAYSYNDITGNNIMLAYKRLLSYGVAGIISVGFLYLVPNKESIFTRLGRNTLYIYLTQGLVLKTFISKGLMLEDPIIGSIQLFLITVAITVSFAIIIPKCKKHIGGVIDGRESKSFAQNVA